MKRRGLIVNFSLLLVLLFGGLFAVRAQNNELTFQCVGVPQYFSVPPGVTQITAFVKGSSGAIAITRLGEDVSGGRGANLSATVNVIPGQVLTVNVGCRTGYGFPRGGLTGRGEAYSDSVPGSGGGASSLLLGNEFLVVAGGGGAAGQPGFFSSAALGGGGGDAQQSTGNGGNGIGLGAGSGGIFAASTTPQGQNGRVTASLITSEGGGGGYDPSGGGGGGGGNAGTLPTGGGGGGGGGESYVNPLYAVQNSFDLGLRGFDGAVTITWTGTSANTVTYRCAETVQNYTVPAGARQLRVTGIGGDGGGFLFQTLFGVNGSIGSGIGGGRTALISVQPGDVLRVAAGCQGKVGTFGGILDTTNPGGPGGLGYISGGRGGDGDHPPLIIDSGEFGYGGGGGSGIGRSNGTPLFVAAGGGGGGGKGGFLGCHSGSGGLADISDGVNAVGCANSGNGGLLGFGNKNGGHGCSFCSSGGGGGGGAGYPSGGGGNAGGIGFGGGGGGRSYAGTGSQDFRTVNSIDYRRIIEADLFSNFQVGIRQYIDANPIDGFLQITPVYTNIAPPVVAAVINSQEPDGNNGWYRSNISLVWDVNSDSPVVTSGCQPVNINADTTGVSFTCQATNAFGSVSGTTPTIKRDATLPNITATAVRQDGTPYVFGTTSNQPVTVTFNCSDATSGVAACPPAQTFGSNTTVSGTVTDNAGNTRTVTFGNIITGNQLPTISEIANINLPINTSSDFINFTVGDDSTPASNLIVTAVSSNQTIVPNTFISLTTEPNPANRTIRITPVTNKIGTTVVTVSVRDGQGATASRNFVVSVSCGTITIQQSSGFPRTFGAAYDDQLSAIGGVGPYSFRLLNGRLPSGLTFSPDFTRIYGDAVGELGTFPLDYEVSDSNGCTVQARITVIIECFTNYTVQSVVDYDFRSLRFAVAGTCPNSVIDFAPSVQNSTIDIATEISLGKPLTIQAPGANNINLRSIAPPGPRSRVFNITATAIISGLTISGGNAANSSGGGILSSFGDLTIRDSVITGNRADYGGGGIANTNPNSTLFLINSTVSNNVGADNLNQGNNAGGIRSLGPVNVVNSTISGNLAGGQMNIAGGLYAPSGLISNSTITNNRVDNTFQTPFNSASGVFGGSNPNRLTIRSSIIAGNQNNAQFPDVVNLFTSEGYNLIGNRGTVTAFNQIGDQTGTSGSPLNPLLDVLGLYGGTTPTHRFLSMLSPAVDKGNSFGQMFDQRGIARYENPTIANAPGGDGADIGAFEIAAPVAEIGFEADIAARPAGDNIVRSDDIVQIRRFLNGSNTFNLSTNEFQRADSAPFATKGDGRILSDDVVQARRYQNGTNPLQAAGGPLAPISGGNPSIADEMESKANVSERLHRELRVEGGTAIAGETVTVYIQVDAQGDEAEYGFVLNYDQRKLSNPVIEDGTAGASIKSCNTATAGQISCSVGGFQNNNSASSDAGIGEIGSGNYQILLAVTFTIAEKAAAGETKLKLSNVNASSDLPELFKPTASAGMVTILMPIL